LVGEAGGEVEVAEPVTEFVVAELVVAEVVPLDELPHPATTTDSNASPTRATRLLVILYSSDPPKWTSI
jgi:hypothetical protein